MGIPGYEIEECLHRGTRSHVARAVRVGSRKQVVLKSSAPSVRWRDACARLQHEFSLAAPIRSAHVVSYLAVERSSQGVVVVEEAFGDVSLAQLLAHERPSLEQALSLGAQIAAGLAEVHAHGVVHRAIHPGNIVIEKSTWTAKIVDFAEASRMTASRVASVVLDEPSIPLSYISPEQTGRMNRTVDYRTDFYSLGATLYHALLGRPPFELSDPLSLVHAHIALSARALSESDEGIPLQVSRIVDKLLAKNPEDRYQSAHGIAADLRACLRQLEASGGVEVFALGQHDLPEQLSIPDKLYGRGKEREELLQAFRAAADGKKQLLLIAGYSGSGKSSLVGALQPTVIEQHGTFVAGKFDPLKQSTPYSALAQALTQLCRGLLGLREVELREWKTRILERVGSNVGLLLELAPELAYIVGPQPPAPETSIVAAPHRFVLTLSRFLLAFASKEHPLVIFLDDLQWADPATLQALTALLRLSEPNHMLVIGAYRDGELGPDHPLTLALAELTLWSTALHTIKLAGLPSQEVASLIADTLHKPRAEVAELAEIVVDKTSGNPFFVDQFLRTLQQEGKLRFSPEERAWTWDPREVEALGLTANVVDLMVRKLARLPLATREALSLGACVGAQFDLSLLASATDLTPLEMRARLVPAIRERLIVPLDPGHPWGFVELSSESAPEVDYRYRFLHDRVQQAAYETLPESERPAIHLRLGRILLARTAPERRSERVFDIVDQLNRGCMLTTDPSERIELAELNLAAGRRARAATAYHEALTYLRRGLALMPDDPFAEHYELACALHLHCAECAYLAGNFEDADAISEKLLPKLRSALEKAELYSIRIVLETNRARFGRAIELGHEALAALGHPIPRLSRASLLAARLKFKLAMGGRSVESLGELPELEDPRRIAVTRVLSQLYPPAYLANHSLLQWLIHEHLYLTIRHGVTVDATRAYSHYTLLLIARHRDYARALSFGRLALRLSQREEAFSVRSQIYMVHGHGANAYAENHVRTSIPLLRRAIDFGLESGDLIFASTATEQLLRLSLMLGVPLDELMREFALRDASVRGFRVDAALRNIDNLRAFVRSLQDEGTALGVSPAALLGEPEEGTPVHALTVSRTYKIIAHTLFGESAAATRMILAHDQLITRTHPGALWLIEYNLYACLALVATLREGRGDVHKVRSLLARKRALLAACAESAPVNFRPMQCLVSAEVADLRPRTNQAFELYERAIREATSNGYLQYAALAAELAGRALLRRKLPQAARAYLEAARQGYAQWGATRKVRALELAYSDLLSHPSAPERVSVSLDTASLVRASQAISSEISLPALLERVMRVILQTSGARRGSLLTEQAGELRIEASLDAERETLDLVSTGTRQSAQFVSEPIVRYTLRTGEDVVLGHAEKHGAFMRDPYVLAQHSKSILCLPIRHRDRITGALFLENELATDAFTEERLEVLRHLVAQAAISLENAYLYESTQELNRELSSKEALLRDFFEGMPVGVYITDAAGCEVLMNRRADELAARDFDPLRIRSGSSSQIYSLGSEQRYPMERSPLVRALAGETSMIDDAELRRGERTIPLAVWGTPIRGENGSVRYAILALQDISQQRAMESERGALEAQLHQAQRLESIGRLAGGIAHDFNNLLMPILAYSELMQHRLAPDSPLRVYAARVEDAAQQAADLTRQLLAMGRKQTLELRALDLNRELEHFEQLFRHVLREGVALELRLAPDLAPVCADAAQLQRILMNLATNAADAMPEGGELTVETENVPGSGDDPLQGASVALRVRDTGQGMSAETLSKIFEPFFTTKPAGKGTGLGLPTVYGLVKQHGGTLSVHSELGRGTTFELLFPLAGAPCLDATPTFASRSSRPPRPKDNEPM